MLDFRALESECDNLQYWSIIRHGTRYPSKKAIRLINNDAEVLKDRIINSPNTKLCPKDIELLRDWSIEVDESQAKDLHREGEEELIYMGERLFSRFPELFHQHSDYDHQNYLFRSTNTQRTVETFKSLALGLFSRPIAKKVKLEEPITPHDPLIRFYKLCSKWITSVKKNDTAKHEYFKFAESQYVTQVRENISTLLGFDEVITHEELEAIYLTCNFDQAWKPRQASPWCALFPGK